MNNIPILPAKKDIWLIYDYECPLSEMYCKEIKIKKDIGNLTFINARKPSTLMNEITSKGLDIDNGMVLKVDDSIYYGREAIHILTLLSTPIGLFSKINHLIFRSKILSIIIYPVYRSIKNLILFKIKGELKINNLNKTNQFGDTLSAFLIAPWPLALIYSLLLLPIKGGYAFLALLIVLTCSYFCLLVFGLPLYLCYKKYQLLKFRYVLPTALSIGLILGSLVQNNPGYYSALFIGINSMIVGGSLLLSLRRLNKH